jgi:hypothetical protein
MHINTHLRQYLAELFLEGEILQTNVAEKTTYI